MPTEEEVLEALRAAEVGDRVRQAAETIYQALIEAELTAVIGAAPYERAESRVAQRNGHRPRTLSTPAGDLELRIPKLAMWRVKSVPLGVGGRRLEAGYNRFGCARISRLLQERRSHVIAIDRRIPPTRQRPR